MADIIIVEDNIEIGNLLCDFLRKEKYSVCLATSGEKALELFEKYGAKIFVLDIMLPGIDGLAVCSKIRETSNAYIIIASAKSDKEDKLAGLYLGADDYVEKPYDIDILLAKIKGVFKRKYAIEEMHEGNLILHRDMKMMGDLDIPFHQVDDSVADLRDFYGGKPYRIKPVDSA